MIVFFCSTFQLFIYKYSIKNLTSIHFILGRECIIPDISRTYHFGAKGVHINPRFQGSYFQSHALNTEINVKFEIDKIRKTEYENNVIQLIK